MINPRVILSGRKINDNVGKYIAEITIKKMIELGKSVNGSRVAVLGLTFKENCNDIRNTKVIDIVKELNSYHVDVLVHDPLADCKEARKEYGVELSDWSDINNVDAVILAVAHQFYLDIPVEDLVSKFTELRLLIDVKSVFDREALKQNDIHVWRL